MRLLHRSKVLFIKYATYFQACWRTSRAPATQLLIFGFRSKMVSRDIGNGLANGLVFISNRLLLYLTGEVRLIAPCKHELGPGGSPENAAGVVVALPVCLSTACTVCPISDAPIPRVFSRHRKCPSRIWALALSSRSSGVQSRSPIAACKAAQIMRC